MVKAFDVDVVCSFAKSVQRSKVRSYVSFDFTCEFLNINTISDQLGSCYVQVSHGSFCENHGGLPTTCQHVNNIPLLK